VGVGETQAGERLANGANGVAHRSAANRSAAGRYFASPVAVGENLQDGDRVSRVKQVGVTPKGIAEVPPDVPGTVWCHLVGMTDSQGTGVLDSAENIA
jgi:hypothetical protein